MKVYIVTRVSKDKKGGRQKEVISVHITEELANTYVLTNYNVKEIKKEIDIEEWALKDSVPLEGESEGEGEKVASN